MTDWSGAVDPELAERRVQRELRRQRQRQFLVRRTVASRSSGSSPSASPAGSRSAAEVPRRRSRRRRRPSRSRPRSPTSSWARSTPRDAGNHDVPRQSHPDVLRARAGPRNPVVKWRYPESGGMCAESSDEHGTSTWCGTGWTGQPNVIPHKLLELRFGAYDSHYHFLNAITGKPIKPDLVTGDLAKGSATRTDTRWTPHAGRATTSSGSSPRTATPTVLWSMDAETAVRTSTGTTMGRSGARGRRLPARGRRELLVLRGPNQPRLREREGHREPPDRGDHSGLGRPARGRLPHRRLLHRELGLVPEGDRLLRELGGPRPGLGHPRPPQGRKPLPAHLPLLDGTTPTRRSWPTTRASCTWRASWRSTTSARKRSDS